MIKNPASAPDPLPGDDSRHWAYWLDSMEGLPDRLSPPPPGEPPLRRRLEWAGEILPGVVLALGLAYLGKFLSGRIGTSLMGFTRSPVSEIMLAILLGLVLRNTLGVPAVYDPGLRFCLRRVLRIGIALLGIRLSLLAVGSIGAVGLPVIAACIVAALLLMGWITRLLKLPRRLGTLIAVGTSICGASAIVATAPAIGADDEEVSYAVACITVFGLMAMFLYPFLAHAIFADDARLAGLFLGTAIHETAQVAGAGLMYQHQFDAPLALDAATVTKLVRNLCMAVVIPLMAFLYHRRDPSGGGAVAPWHQMIPLFVLGFVLMSLLRTLGDWGETPFGFLAPDTWDHVVAATARTAKWFLGIAMAAVGLGTSLRRILRLGLRPFAAGLAAALLVGAVSLVLVGLLGRVT